MKDKQRIATQTNIKYCSQCGNMILGEYEYVKTRRGTEMYFCKGMKCKSEKINHTGYTGTGVLIFEGATIDEK